MKQISLQVYDMDILLTTFEYNHVKDINNNCSLHSLYSQFSGLPIGSPDNRYAEIICQ